MPAELPTEGWFDTLIGQKLRREYLGRVYGGQLLLGGIARASGVDLYFRRTQGNLSKPKPREIDADLKRFIERWTQQLRQQGKPVCQRSGNLTWLTTMPLGHHRVEIGPAGCSIFFRFTPLPAPRPLIRQPMGALDVSLGRNHCRKS